ncbi:hypothetical protein CAEBREN_17543 [Caenorhabditis brenneri]|uniref:Copper transport protein n=1 Tax=Caenorhabditis brenneri TaxID=135651 RepID=G0NQY0_CAEBE|nr:hypothetical protein CAEBREN_17543 [Caenorhabditis brenneri]
MDMDMTLHFGEREKILFSWWKTGSFSGMAVSMLISFLLCILYEAIKSFRYFLAVWNNQKRQQRHAEASITNPQNSGGDGISEDSVHIAPLVQLSGFTKRLFTSYRLAQGALYGLQALLAYALMLIVMTYNMNLILSIVVGEAVGYFLFTGNPLVDQQLSDCC